MSKAFAEILIKETLKKNRNSAVKKSMESFPIQLKSKIKEKKPMWKREKWERFKRNSWVN